MTKTPTPLTIHIIDDDAALRRSLSFLLESVGWQTVAHACAEEFLSREAANTDDIACLVLDIRMPRMSGLELQQQLRTLGWTLPVVFITGHGDVELAVQAMKYGASDFLEKPFRDQALIDAVAAAVRKHRNERTELARRETAASTLLRLSPREREVAVLVARGLPNKSTARELGISEKTVHVHRAHIMAKTGLNSAAELTRLMLRADPDALD